MVELEKAMAEGPGQILANVSLLEFMLSKGVSISPADIPIDELSALRILDDERAKWMQEQQEKPHG